MAEAVKPMAKAVNKVADSSNVIWEINDLNLERRLLSLSRVINNLDLVSRVSALDKVIKHCQLIKRFKIKEISAAKPTAPSVSYES